MIYKMCVTGTSITLDSVQPVFDILELLNGKKLCAKVSMTSWLVPQREKPAALFTENSPIWKMLLKNQQIACKFRDLSVKVLCVSYMYA